MIKPEHLRDLVITPTLQLMDEAFPGAGNPRAIELLLGIAAHESTIAGVTYLKQQGGPALGIYQVEPATHDDVWINYLEFRPARRELMQSLLPAGVSDPLSTAAHDALITSLSYATAIARIVIYRSSFDWPAAGDVAGLGAIWKTHYNTGLGAGTVDQFVDHYPLEIA